MVSPREHRSVIHSKLQKKGKAKKRVRINYRQYMDSEKAYKLGASYKKGYPTTYTPSQTGPQYRKSRYGQIQELERIHYATGMPINMALGLLRRKYKKVGMDFLPNYTKKERLTDADVERISKKYGREDNISHRESLDTLFSIKHNEYADAITLLDEFNLYEYVESWEKNYYGEGLDRPIFYKYDDEDGISSAERIWGMELGRTSTAELESIDDYDNDELSGAIDAVINSLEPF